MGIGTKIKEALSGDSHESRESEYSTPGAYPSETASKPRHNEPASGTATSSHGIGSHGTATHTSGTHGLGSHGTTGQSSGHGNTSSYEYGQSSTTGVGSSGLTSANRDPGTHMPVSAGHSDGNPLSTAGIAGDTVGTSTGSSHNKLHKPQDPRGLDDASHTGAQSGIASRQGAQGDSTGYGAGSTYNDQRYDAGQPGNQGTHGVHGSHGTHGTHGAHGAHGNASQGAVSGYDDTSAGRGPPVPEKEYGNHGTSSGLATGAAVAGASGLAAHEYSDHRRHEDSDRSRREDPQGNHGLQHGQGGGVYNTVTGTGSSEDHSRGGHHHGTDNNTSHHQGHTGSGAALSSVAPAGAHSGGHHTSQSYQDSNAYPRDTKGSGGLNPGLLDIGGTGGSSSHHGQGTYDTTGASRDQHSLDSHSHGTHGLAGAGAGVGAGAAASHLAHRQGHGSEEAGHRSDAYESNRGTEASESYGHPSSTTSHSTHSGHVGQGMTGPSSGHGLSGADSGLSKPHATSHGGLGNTTGQGSSSSSAGIGAGGGSGSGPNTGPDYYGPGHQGAKVLHQCQHCGQDNDISHYFRKEVTYRMG